jgi:hypothetical protein
MWLKTEDSVKIMAGNLLILCSDSSRLIINSKHVTNKLFKAYLQSSQNVHNLTSYFLHTTDSLKMSIIFWPKVLIFQYFFHLSCTTRSWLSVTIKIFSIFERKVVLFARV